MLFKLFLVFVSLNLANEAVNASVTVTQVNAGQLAELPCLSSDDLHRFMFWLSADESKRFNNLISPGNPLDEQKYNYEVLTGKLLIKVTFLKIFRPIFFF